LEVGGILSTTIIATVFVLGLLIFVHEFGHFITAKLVGMRVDEFALGFGPKVISKKYGETTYSLRIIPLGGFNKIAGMDPDEEQDEYSFNAKPIWARMLVIFAGAFMNFVLPILLFLIVFLSDGIAQPVNQALLGDVIAGKPAAQAGLIAGDRVLAINDTKVNTWNDFVGIIRVSANKPLTIIYDRNGQINTTSLVPELDTKESRGIIGVMSAITYYRPGPVEALGMAFKYTGMSIANVLNGIGQMLTGKAAADVSGPIGVAQMAGKVAQLGFTRLLEFAAFLSINLGLLNLFPVPVLDGGHIVTLAIEAVRRKPLQREKLQILQMLGFALLMLLMIFATLKDITRIKPF
jgi:regulator of sigma E protease